MRIPVFVLMSLAGLAVFLKACGDLPTNPAFVVPTPTVDALLANVSPLALECGRYRRVYVGDVTHSVTVYAGKMDDDGPRVEIRTLDVDLHALVYSDTGLVGEMLVFDGLYYAREPEAAWVQTDFIPMRDYELFPEGHNTSCPSIRYLMEIGYGIIDAVLAEGGETELPQWPMVFHGSDESIVIPDPAGVQPRSLGQDRREDD